MIELQLYFSVLITRTRVQCVLLTKENINLYFSEEGRETPVLLNVFPDMSTAVLR